MTGIDEVLHVRQKWVEIAGFLILAHKVCQNFYLRDRVCVTLKKIENNILVNSQNHICEILQLMFNDLQEHNQLPSDYPVLYLQIGNCSYNKKTCLLF